MVERVQQDKGYCTAQKRMSGQGPSTRNDEKRREGEELGNKKRKCKVRYMY